MAGKIPKDERVWMSYRSSDGKIRFVVTSKASRETYFLYEADGEGFKKLGKSPSPAQLEEKYEIMKQL